VDRQKVSGRQSVRLPGLVGAHTGCSVAGQTDRQIGERTDAWEGGMIGWREGSRDGCREGATLAWFWEGEGEGG
jgi:hypothetical protein